MSHFYPLPHLILSKLCYLVCNIAYLYLLRRAHLSSLLPLSLTASYIFGIFLLHKKYRDYLSSKSTKNEVLHLHYNCFVNCGIGVMGQLEHGLKKRISSISSPIFGSTLLSLFATTRIQKYLNELLFF